MILERQRYMFKLNVDSTKCLKTNESKYIFLTMRMYITIISLCFVLIFVSTSCYASDLCPTPYPDQSEFDNTKRCWTYEELIYDESSEKSIEPNGEATVRIHGGKPPHTWRVEGQGFYLDQNHSIQEITSNVREIKVYAKDACGSAESWTLLSESGGWELLGYWRTRDYIGHLHPDIYRCTTNMYSWNTSWTIAAYKGKYAISASIKGPGYREDTNYNGAMHPWCASSDIKAITYNDPIVGQFEIPGTTGSNHYIDGNIHDDIPGFYRIGYYLSRSTNTNLYVFQYVCN